MNWKDKIKVGMEIIKKACKEAVICYGCPFEKYCDILTESDDILHNEWIFEDDEDN